MRDRQLEVARAMSQMQSEATAFIASVRLAAGLYNVSMIMIFIECDEDDWIYDVDNNNNNHNNYADACEDNSTYDACKSHIDTYR